jgi:hypothetical protein
MSARDKLANAGRTTLEKLRQPFGLRIWHVLAGSALLGLVLVGVVVLFTVIAFRLSDTQQEQIEANERAIDNNRRLDRLEKPPSDRELARAAANALEGCVADRACRAALRGAIRQSNLRPSDVPNISGGSDDSRGTSSGTTGSAGSGGSGDNGASQSGPQSRRSGPSTVVPPSPPRRPRRPAPGGPAPPAPSTTAPAPARPTPPRQPTPPTPSTPIPVPRPTVPRPPTPTVPPVPTIPVPPLPNVQVCTPVVTVNCRDARGRVVAANGRSADPASSSGRGNDHEPLCERLEVPCDEDGGPVFPVPLIQLF